MKNMSKITPHHTNGADVVSIASKFHKSSNVANPIPTFIYLPFAVGLNRFMLLRAFGFKFQVVFLNCWPTKARENNHPTILFVTEENKGIHAFPQSISQPELALVDISH